MWDDDGRLFGPLYSWRRGPHCRENDPFRGSLSSSAKSLIRLVLDRRKNLAQKESMKIGYARVSTEEQNLDLQIEALTEAGCDRIITDQAQSGAKAAETRPGFSEALNLLSKNDLLGPVDNHLEAISAATRFQHAA